jgi:hypothetical protein
MVESELTELISGRGLGMENMRDDRSSAPPGDTVRAPISIEAALALARSRWVKYAARRLDFEVVVGSAMGKYAGHFSEDDPVELSSTLGA